MPIASTTPVQTHQEKIVPATASASTTVQKKKNRPNPARRKASQANRSIAKVSSDVKSTKNMSNSTVAVTTSPHSVSSAAVAKETRPSAQKMKPTASIVKTEANTSTTSQGSILAHSPKPSTSKSTPTPSTLITTPAVLTTGGLLGCVASAAILLGAGLWKDVAGSSAVILTVRTAKHCVDNLSDELITQLNAGTYNAPEALDILRRTTLAYACAIPGGAAFVERVFREVEMVRTQRAAEVDRVVAQACRELVGLDKKSASEEKVGAMVGRQLLRLSEVAGLASRDVLDRNPAMMRDLQKAVKAAPPEMKVPTVKVNMVVKQTG